MADLVARVAQIMAKAVRQAHDSALLPERLCLACVEALSVHAAAISLMADSTHRVTVRASHEAAARIEDLQYTLGEGPCVEAFETGRPVLVSDLAGPDGDRWPVLASTAVRAAPVVRGVFAFPLHLNGTRFGVLDLYRFHPGPLDLPTLAGARVAVDAARLALAGSFLPTDAKDGDWPPWLQDPLLEGVEVDQAVGMIMAQLRVPAEVALSRLRGYAFANDQSVTEVAKAVVERRTRFTEHD